MARFIFIFFLSIVPGYYFSQCCGGCNPIGGNTNQGTLPKYMLQVNGYHRNAYSQGYMEKDHSSDFKFVKNAQSNYEGLQVGYGLSKRLTVDLETGYYLNRSQYFQIYGYNYSLNGFGGSSFTFSGRYNILKDTVRDIEFTGGIGIKVPWSTKPLVTNGVELSEDVQPSNGAYGVVVRTFFLKEFDKAEFKFFLINTVNINSTNPKAYKEGNTYLSALFFSKKVAKRITAIFQIRNEIREHSYRDKLVVTSSGGCRFIFIPQLNYTIKKNYNLSLLYELPFYQYYNGIQLRDVYAISINLNMRFMLNKKAREICEKPL
ncbi:MAG: hypothetical protein H0W61_10440 [Bacteroidetes bacterium]|nr:hypothetical protein [Bacteroidota bacterium]